VGCGGGGGGFFEALTSAYNITGLLRTVYQILAYDPYPSRILHTNRSGGG